MNRLLAALAAVLPCVVAGQGGGPVDRTALVGEHSSLSNGQPDWNSLSLQLGRHWSPRQVAGLELTRTRRFGLSDSEIAVGGSLPLSETLTGSMRMAYSPTHRVVAHGSVAAGLQWEFRRAWLLHGTARHTRYSSTIVNQSGVMLEHYFADFSVLGAVHSVRAFGRSQQVAELRGAWYYGDASSVGLIASFGDEAAQVAPGRVALSRVRSAAVTGSHAFAGGPWTLRYGVHRVRQGSFHTRTGATLGVQRDF